MFQRAKTFLIGLLCGVTLGVMVPWIATYKGGKNIRQRWQSILQASSQAAELRRQELQQQLLSLTTRSENHSSN
jgi:gas vesicle protein